ncbi:GNAT family N-acetyltransferase [Streptomyces polyrhachis]|uniref:GNAT family N-acetyltransferase n=1 Tax=Streptomyces polyrhachis TaxID=1282885 RepID=A0ABW2GBH5_9ACTN
MSFPYDDARPQLLLDARAPSAAPRRLPAGVTVRVVAAGDPGLASALAVTRVAYGDPGTVAGIARALAETGELAEVAEGVRYGRRIVAAAFDADDVALAAAHCSPDGEVHTVGTLPAARRLGLAYEVTRVLLDEARGRGQRAFHLTAETPEAELLYASLGFRKSG